MNATIDLAGRAVMLPRIEFDRLVPLFPRRPTVRILVVADTSVSFTNDFGVGRVVDLVRANADGYVRFEVDLARLGEDGSALSVNPSPTGHQEKYLNFRFASRHGGNLVIDDYDQLWCFGFAPGNDGSTSDDNVWASPYRSTPEDLAALTTWMNAGGGVLAMGDHHYLGAAMCAEIPRVRSMRRWTNAQNVPPIGGTDRHDTNRPMNPAQDAAQTPDPVVIPSFPAQEDGVPQPVDWKGYETGWPVFPNRSRRPHPVLCGGSLGVIDVLPDHPHEGWVFEEDEIDLAATYAFDGVSGDEYPTVAGGQPAPEVIAWGTTLPDPPYWHGKGDSPAKRFGLIGAYDGDAADVGRVLVDSTWHHWMDVNLLGLEAEAPDTEFRKIVRYFRNCAVWLARAEQRQQMLVYSVFWSTVLASTFEDMNRRHSIWELGGFSIDVIGRHTSDCLVRDWLRPWLDPELVRWLEHPPVPVPDPEPPFPVPPDPCWSCPPFELLERAVVGGIVKELLPVRDRIQAAGPAADQELELSPDEYLHLAERGANRGLEAFQSAVADNLRTLERFRKMDGKVCRLRRTPERNL